MPPTSNARNPAPPGDRYVSAWLHLVVRHRVAVLLLTAVAVLTFAALATRLHKDTSANAYIEPDNPALQYRERVIDTFGLKEPIVIAVRHAGEDGILNPQSLQLVRSLVDRLERMPNIDIDRITSLASRSSISGSDGGIDIAPLLPAGPIDDAAVARLRHALAESPLHDGTLVSKDRTATVIVAELLDEARAADTYRAVLDLTRSIHRERDEELFVAGAAAITGYFSTYIDRDASRLVPFTALAVLFILFCAFLTVRSSLLPMAIAVITLLVTLGLMGATGVPFYAITNGMVVVLIGISVAEPMHVFGEYYTLLRQSAPAAPHAPLIVRAFLNAWRPITLTSITTVAGFFSLWVTSSMPPIRYFGLFGALGVVVALVLTFSFLPAAMASLPKRNSRLMKSEAGQGPDPVTRWMLALGIFVIRWPRAILAVAAGVCALALLAAWQVKVDHARIENFNASEPLHIADEEINRTLAGTNQLDIVIEAAADEGVLTPRALRKIESLQAHLLTLPEVGGVISIVDYLRQLHRAVQGTATGSLPDDPDLIAQLMLTYQASAPPTEFQALVDSSGRTALVRAYLHADRWSDQRHVVDAAQRFIDREFTDDSLVATLTGRVMLDYEWVQSVASGHALSVIVSTLSVLAMCVVIFRSLRDGLLCLAPLVVSVLCVYAAMGLADIWLGVATSMFASVAIGLGIDFAIHMVSRANQSPAADGDARLLHVFRSTGRAVLFNATAVGLGFAIVTLSAAPPVRMFGLLVSIAVLGAFVAALTVLPALLKVIYDHRVRRETGQRKELAQMLAPVCLVAIALGCGASTARADSTQNADAIMAAVASRPDGTSADRVAHIRLIDRNGGTREQTARAVRLDGGEGRRMAIFYQTPANIRGTAFLVHDYTDPSRDSDQWLYLPALRKVRRVPAADRGDYFLGTDLTYDEIRNDNRVTMEDWRFRLIDRTQVDGVSCSIVEGNASSDAVARELGYSRAHWWIDMASHMALRIEYWDRAGQLLKTVRNLDVRQVDGVWTALQVDVTNHKTGHRTQIQFRDVRFNAPLADSLFTQQQMERGL